MRKTIDFILRFLSKHRDETFNVLREKFTSISEEDRLVYIDLFMEFLTSYKDLSLED